MTPEQTLDWLAQQHFDQCREERPIQDWIRKMKSELPEQPKQNTVEAVKAVLKGIDQTEIESPDGWWETSAGAEFGAKKLKYVVGLLAQQELCKYGQEPKSCTSSPMDCQCAIDATFAQSEQDEHVAWGVDWGKDGQQSCVSIVKRKQNGGIEVVAIEYNPTPSTPQRTWVGLTEDERTAIRESAAQYHDVTGWGYAKSVQQATELKLQEKNA